MTHIRTAFLTQWYPPEPVEVPRSIATALSARDHDVVVLTGVPNYPDGQVTAGYAAAHRSRETIDGLRVERFPLYPSHDQSPARRVLTYLSWAASTTVLSLRLLRLADVVLVYSSPATAALAPALWRRVTQTPYVLLVQDLWPESVFASGMLGRGPAARAAERVLRRFCDWMYRGAAEVAVISPGMTDVLTARGVDPDRVTLVYNWAPERSVAGADEDPRSARRQLGLPEAGFVVTYAGNVGVAQSLDSLLLAAEILRRTGVVVAVAGDGVDLPRLKDLAADRGIDNVVFLGRLDVDQMPLLHAATDLHVVSLTADPLFEVTMPSKVQSILASGSRILVVANGDAAAVAVDSGAGWSVEPGDAPALAEAIRVAQHEPAETAAGRRSAALDYYRRHMSREAGSTALDGLLRRAAGSREGRSA